ncbi:MAG TPA: hypothetical protein VHF69_14345, partial [Candidatus Synoicihabitans sp.]|nr:hypothetical protein [Candidatus Synoicihabitans sp.]
MPSPPLERHSHHQPSMKHHGVRHRTRLSDRLLESLTVWHAGAFVIAATWGFGGNIYWMRTPLALWGTYGILLTIAGLCYRLRRHPEQRTPLRSLAPLALFIGLVLLSATNPNHATAHFFGNLVLRPIPPERP